MTTARKSRFAGVTWDAAKELWNAYVKVDGYAQPIGWFETEEDAAEAQVVRLASAHRAMFAHDVEQDERWDHVAGSDFVPSQPDRVYTRGVVPGPTVRRATPLSAPVTSSGRRAHPPFAA